MATKGFKRQRLLDVRDIMLQVEAVSLRHREDQHIRERLLLASALQTREEELDILTDAERGVSSANPREFLLRTWRTMELNHAIEEKLATSRETAQAVELQRQVVEEASKLKRSLEKLKEHQEEEARIDFDRQNQKAMDEVAARKYLESSHGRATG